MPARLRPLAAGDRDAVLARLDAHEAAGQHASATDVRAAVKHYLAVLAEGAPGKSVEVRVPPYAAVQCVEGARHTRGTPPAVVETDAASWLAMARGLATFTSLVEAGSVRASGERSDLTPFLPLD